MALRSDTLEAEQARDVVRERHYEHNMLRDSKYRELLKEFVGWEHLIEPELEKLGLGPLDPLVEMRPEVTICFKIRQITLYYYFFKLFLLSAFILYCRKKLLCRICCGNWKWNHRYRMISIVLS